MKDVVCLLRPKGGWRGGLQLATSDDGRREGTWSNLGPEILSKESTLLLFLPDPSESLCNEKFTIAG